jgi:hypothetical protein
MLELEITKDEIDRIIHDDLRNVKNLAISKNKAIVFNEFLKPPSIFKTAFYIESDHSQYIVLLCSLDYEHVNFTISC